ncbi:MAG: DEAD/DEAH box helicase, partial [Vicinamibacteraceae bacterium]
EVTTVPTGADARAQRLDLTRASLRERLLVGNLDDVRVVVESLAEEFDIVDVAAAAVKMAHSAGTGDEKRDIPVAPSPARVTRRKGQARRPYKASRYRRTSAR